MIAESTIHSLLRTAIQEKRLIRFRYQNKERIAEPHDYGIQKRVVRLLAYQVSGESSGKLPNWRRIDVEKMPDLQMLERKFAGGRSIPSGKHQAWDPLFLRVEPRRHSPE